MISRVAFFNEDVSFVLKQKNLVKNWVKQCIESEGKRLAELNYIFCSDDYLLSINQQYLNHNTLTDIITFDNSEEFGLISGDIFISVDRVKENADLYHTTIIKEIHRVIIHGALHLLGYKDKSAKDKSIMTQKEDEYLLKRFHEN